MSTFFIELSYILTLLVGVACFTVHITVREKNLMVASPLIKWKSTTMFLALIMAFNICDFLIIYLGDDMGAAGITWIYVAENLLEVFLAYAMICMGKDYAQMQNPKWLDAIFIAVALMIFYIDSMHIIKGGNRAEYMYVILMIAMNLIPVVLLCFFGLKYWKTGRLIRNHPATDLYMKIYNLVAIMLCIISTASIIDSRTTRDLIWCDREIYVTFWIVFNVLNFIFVWKSCMADDREDSQRCITIAERMEALAEQYGLSTREKEIAELIYCGRNNKEIASALFLSPNTIKVHASNLYRKLGVDNRVQAVAVLRGEE